MESRIGAEPNPWARKTTIINALLDDVLPYEEGMKDGERELRDLQRQDVAIRSFYPQLPVEVLEEMYLESHNSLPAIPE